MKNVDIAMAMQYEQIPQPAKPFVICDIDGTLSDTKHRLHYLDNKDWDAFFDEMVNDPPREEIFEMIRNYHTKGHAIILVSGRPDTYRKQTEEWIRKHSTEDLGYLVLLMRRGGNCRPDTEVKQEIYDKYLKHYPIEVAIDDRPSILRMWEKNGVKTIDVGKGIEF